MDCVCFNRKKSKEPKIIKKKNEEYWKTIEALTSPKLDPSGNDIYVSCSFIIFKGYNADN